MSRDLSATLDTTLASSGLLSLVLLVKVVRRDGTTEGYCSWGQDLVYDGLTYEASSAITASQLRNQVGTGVDNLDVEALLRSDGITEVNLRAGLYDGAQVYCYVVDRTNLSQIENPFQSGTLGEITYREGQYTAELRGLSQRFAQIIGENTSPVCRVRALGDERCKVTLSVAVSAVTKAANGQVTTATPHKFRVGARILFDDVGGMVELNGTVHTVASVTGSYDASTVFTIATDTTGYGTYTSGGTAGYQSTHAVLTAPSQTQVLFGTNAAPANWYAGGRVRFTTGLNANLEQEVKGHTFASTAAHFTTANSEYLSRADSALLSVPSTSISVGCYFYLTGAAGFQVLIAKGGWDEATNQAFGLHVTGAPANIIEFQVASSAGVRATATAASTTFNAWHLAIGRYDLVTGLASIQIDALSPVNSPGAATGGLRDDALQFRVGARDQGASPGYLTGYVARVFLLKRLLSTAEGAMLAAAPLMTYTDLPTSFKTSMVDWWDLTETSTGVGAVSRAGQHAGLTLTDNGTTPSIGGQNGPAGLTLQLPFPFAIAAGDVALLESGCPRTFAACRAYDASTNPEGKFSNSRNYRGEPHLPGNSRLAVRARR